MPDRHSVTLSMMPVRPERVVPRHRGPVIDAGLAQLMLIVVLGIGMLTGPALSVVQVDGGTLSVAGE